MSAPCEITQDGYDVQWQTNHLAHWLFKSQLLPILLGTAKTLSLGSVQVVNLTSSGHFYAPKGGINFADTSLPNESGMIRDGQSKLADVLLAKFTLQALRSRLA